MLNIKNITILKYGLMISGFSIIINIMFYLQFSIRDIIFLEHFYYKEIQDGSKLEFFYIKNANDNSEITHISFPEMSENFAYVVLEENPIISQEFAHYHCNKITLTFYIPKNLDKKENKTVLKKGIVRFNNGKEKEIIFGNIVLLKNSDNLNDFTTIDTSYSDDNLYSSTKVANKNIFIENMAAVFYDEIKDIIHMKFNDISIKDISFPFIMSKGEELTFESQLIISKNDTRRYNVYNIDNYILFTDSDDKSGCEYFYNISYNPFDLILSEKDIMNFIEYKGVK